MAPLPRYRLSTASRTSAAIGRSSRAAAGRAALACAEARSLASLGAPHAALAPRARVAVHLAMKGLMQPGQKVVLSPYAIADVVNIVVAAGGVPVFADVERETW